MTTITIRGRKVYGGVTEGEALVSHDTISGWGGIDFRNGTIIERRHELAGQCFTDKIFVFPGVKGSSGSSGMFHRTRMAGTAPRAMIFNEMNTKAALVCTVLRVPAMTDLDRDPVEVIKTGDRVKINADEGIIEVTRQDR